MSKLPSFTPKEVERLILKNGFFLKRQSGSHRTYYKAELHATVVIPFHCKDLPKGTLKSIIKQSRLGIKIFFKK